MVDLRSTKIESFIYEGQKERNKGASVQMSGKQKTKKKDELKELTETLQRLQAEFENYKKRIEKENIEFRKYAKAELISKLLPMIDNFELALQNKENKDEFVKGIELIYSQLFSLLENEGLKVIKAKGEKFNPEMHEALLTEKSDKENIVLEELQKGYMLEDKILRHAKVKVSKKGD